MKEAIWSRVRPATGLVFFVLLIAGFIIHGYPEIRPTDSQLAKWLATVDVNRFRLGMYVEVLGIAMFIPFASWLFVYLRQGARDATWPAVAMLAAAAGWVAFTLPITGAWAGLVDQARKGLDIHAAQTVVSINQASYDTTAVLLGLTLVAAGAAIIQGAAMSRWAGWAAIIIGAIQVVSSPFGIDSTPAGLLAYLWIIAVAGYYTFWPARGGALVASSHGPAGSTGLPAMGR